MSTSRYAQDIDLADLNNSHTLAILSVPPGSRVLDIGAANGSVARALVDRGCTVCAVEVDPASAREAEEHCEEVVVADVEQLDVRAAFGGRDFDAVLLLDVLEHLRDPHAVLRDVTRVVRADGRLIVSVPNVAHAAVKLALLGGRFRYTELGLLDKTHLRFFDKPALDQLLADAGLVVHEELRVSRGLTETEIPIDPNAFSPDVVAEATQDPESETYQFVVVAGAGRDRAEAPVSLTSALKREVDELQTRIREARSHARSLEEQLATKDAQLGQLERKREEASELEQVVRRQDAELSASRREVSLLNQDLRLKEKYLAELRAAMAESRAELRAREASLASVQSSLSWRVTSPLRSVKRRLRRKLGGLGS